MADGRDDPRQRSLNTVSVAAKQRLARLVLLWEALAKSLWPFAGVVLAALAAIFLGLPKSLGDISGGWLHVALIAAFVLGLLWSARRAVQAFEAPDDDDIRRRLEQSSEVEHRPLTVLEDVLTNNQDPVANALWKAHRQRILATGARWRVGFPRALLAIVDPLAVRAALGLLLIVGLVISWKDPGGQLAAALDVDLALSGKQVPAKVDLWVNPPVHTGAAPMLLASPDRPTDPNRVIKVPVNSMVLASVNGASGEPVLAFIDADGLESAAPLKAQGKGVHKAEAQVRTSLTVVVRDGATELLRLPLSVLSDLRPSVAFDAPPTKSERESLILRYTAEDDYGIETVVARIERLQSDGTVAEEEPLLLELPVPGIGETKVSGRGFNDLTPHPWAGQPVNITLQARDEVGQTGDSDPARMILPERIFNHPVARAIIEQRKRLVATPGDRHDIAKVVMSLAVRPHHYFDDIVVFMALKSASSRLLLNENQDRAVVDLLWDTALRIEEGEVSLAARELRELERKLQEALANNAPQEEIEKLMDQLRDAMERYLQAMAEQMRDMQQQSQKGEQREIDPDQMLQRQDLMEMLDRARELSRNGARDAARGLLAKLQEMMENLRMGKMPEASQQQQAYQEMMRQLQEMTRKQQELMDKTFKAHRNRANPRDGQGQQPQGWGKRDGKRQQGQPRMGRRGEQRDPNGQRNRGQGQRPGDPSQRNGGDGQQSLSEMQEQLRRQLGEFMRRLGEGTGQIPQGLGEAERSMKDAVGDLREGQMGAATGAQGDAVEQLREGGQSLSQQMQERMQGAGDTRQSGVQGQRQNPNEQDPMGRNRNGVGDYDRTDVGIPEESDVIKARRILEELRRRAGDHERPTLELDYIDRLLKRF